MADNETCSHAHYGPLLVIAAVGLVVFTMTVFAGLLALWNRPIALVLAFLGLVSNGISLLIPSPLTKLQPQSVTVANPPSDPVPTQPVPAAPPGPA